jgi:hypothetical protein
MGSSFCFKKSCDGSFLMVADEGEKQNVLLAPSYKSSVVYEAFLSRFAQRFLPLPVLPIS